MNLESKKDRSAEKVDCTLLSITESVHWAMGLPYVVTNMSFIHVQNVPSEDRFVRVFPRRKCWGLWNVRNTIDLLPNYLRPTVSQQTLQEDIYRSEEAVDRVTEFGLRSPELLCVDKIEVYFRCFALESCKETENQVRRHLLDCTSVPWINFCGKIEKVRAQAVDTVTDFLLRKPATVKSKFILNILEKCRESRNKFEVWLYKCENTLLPEIVFKSVSPRNPIKFLVSFVLRFGSFETELDLFLSPVLRESHVKAGLLQQCDRNTGHHILALLRIYVYDELRYSPGGALTWSAKLLGAQAAFAQLLELQGEDTLPTPTVLIGRMHEEMQSEVSAFVDETQHRMLNQAQLLQLDNCPTNIDAQFLSAEWLPQVNFAEN